MNCHPTTLCVSILLLIQAAGSYAQGHYSREQIEIPSQNPADYVEILNGKAPALSLKVDVYIPASATGPVPVVVSSHGSGGVGDREIFFRDSLVAAGFAYVIPDSFGSRGVRNTGVDQGKVSYAAQVADALATLKFLIADKRFESRRVGIMGFSRGGMVTHMSAHRPLVAAVLDKESGYRAHFSITPACNVHIENWKTDKVKFFIALGEKDDLTPAQTCVPVIEKLKAAGADVTVKTYSGGYHGFQTSPVGRQWLPGLQKISTDQPCPIVMNDAGITAVEGPKVAPNSIVVGNDWAGFVEKWMAACGTRGAYIGTEVDYREIIKTDVVTFFVNAMPK